MSTFVSYDYNDNTKLIGKVLIVGDSATGKTSIFNRFIDNGFCSQTPATIGIDFHASEIKLEASRLSTKLSAKLEKMFHESPISPMYHTTNQTNLLKNLRQPAINEKIRLQIWDAAGQEKFRNIVKAYYRNSSVVILVFDQCKRESFDHLYVWVEQILNSQKWEDEMPLFVLVGNKSDLTEVDKKCSFQYEIDKFCDQYDITSYYSVSAKLDNNIKNILVDIAHELYFHVEFVRVIREQNNMPDYPLIQKLDEELVRPVCCNLL